MDHRTLQGGLADLQRRYISVGARNALVWSAFVALAVLLAAMWIDLVADLPPAVRIVCSIAAVAFAIGLFARAVMRAIAASRPNTMATHLDTAAQANGEILSGVDLALRPSASGNSMSLGLSMIAVQRAADLMRHVPAAAVLPLKALRTPLMLLIAAGLFAGLTSLIAPWLAMTQWLRFTDPFGDHPPYSPLVFSIQPGDAQVIFGKAIDVNVKVDGGTPDRVDLVLIDAQGKQDSLPMFPEPGGAWRSNIANVTAAGEYFATSGRARSQRYHLGVITVPRIESVAFHVAWPAYTHRPPYDGPLPQGGLVGLPGTVVRVTAKSNRALSGGTLSFSSGSTEVPATMPSAIAMSPSSNTPSEVFGSFTIETAGKLSVSVIDTDGQSSTDPYTAAVGVLKDQRPFVRLTEPKANSFATPDVSLQVIAIAEDDFGISKVSLYRGLNDTRPRPMDIPVPLNAPTQFPATTNLPLAEYGLHPGDVVKLFARVEDNDPAGPKGAESTVVEIHIVSQQDMDKMVLQREGLEALENKYAQAARRMEQMADRAEKLKDELAKLDPNSALADEKRKELDQLATDLEAAAGEVEKLSDHQLPIDLDKALTKELDRVASAMREAAKETKAAAKPGFSAAGASDKLAAACKALGGEKKDFKENAQDPLDHLAEIYPLIEDQARYIDLAAQQKDLAERMKALGAEGEQNDPKIKARMRDLQDQQEQARHDLLDLLDDIHDHVEKLPPDERLDKLRTSARRFADAVAQSDARARMQESEAGLSDFDGDRAAGNAMAAAETLKRFISLCNGMGKEGEVCLNFQPKLASGLGNSVQQLLEASGLGTGGAVGRGRGGYSAMRSSLKNVGLYGTLPIHGAETSKAGGGKADRGTGATSGDQPDQNANPDGSGKSGANQASGESYPAVPPAYQKRVGDYFRRVADELDQ